MKVSAHTTFIYNLSLQYLVIKVVKKRDGSVEEFSKEKLEKSINLALQAANAQKKASQVTKKVIANLSKVFVEPLIPSADDVAGIIKDALKSTPKALAAYASHHEQKPREFKATLGVRNDLDLSENALRVLVARYLLRDAKGRIVETPARLFRRVASAVAQADVRYRKGYVKQTEDSFYDMMASLDFLPNSPTLMNAGTALGQLSACFVLPVGDSLDEIFTTLKDTALIHQSGGGTGFNFSNLRPRGDIVGSTKGVASGPISFMRVFDVTTDVLKQGGKRRGANMGILNCDHPDIVEFIVAKSRPDFSNFNISVAATDAFMNAVLHNEEYSLINPHTKNKVKSLNAREVFELIVAQAHKTGDPGLVFIDEINKKNPTAKQGRIESTNPCGEQPLHPYESCNLGSINLAKMVRNGKIDWDKFKKTIHKAVHFLDNVIDVNKYIIPQIGEITRGNRRIGLGVMGFAELLIQIGVPYDSPKAIETAEAIGEFLAMESRKESDNLANERGSFPNVEQSVWKKTRNATVTTIAPTGTISIIAQTTSGIEPLFAVSYVRNVLDNAHLLEVNPLFERIARERGFYSRELMVRISKTGSVQGITQVPKDVQKLFKTALEIPPEQHVKIQAAFQKFCDNAVSKTINLPSKASKSDVRKAYLLAYKLGCKGITMYRYGSKENQVLSIPVKKTDHVVANVEYAGGHVCKDCLF